MNKQLSALKLERGRLQERIAQQRTTLVLDLLPLTPVGIAATRVLAAGQAGVSLVRRNPLLVWATLAVVLALRPKGLWRLAKTGLVVWRGSRALLAMLPAPTLSLLYQFVLQRFILK